MSALPYWRLSSYYFFHFAFIGAFSPYFGLYLKSLSFSAWDIGLVMSQMQLMRMFAPYLWGALADRQPRRTPIIRLAAAISLVSFVAFFFTTSLGGLLAAMAMLAFFWSAALPLVETQTFDHLRDDPARYSRIRVWGSIGFIVAVMAVGAWLEYRPISHLLWMLLATQIGIMVCALRVPEAKAHTSSTVPAPSLAAILRQTRVRALLAACFAMSAAHGAYYVFYSIHLAGHGYSTSLVGGLWSLGVIAEIGVFMIMAPLLRRFSLRAILLTCFAAAALRFVMIGWGVDSLAIIFVAQLLHALTFGAHHAAAIAAINRWFPGRAQGRGQALYSSLSFGAGGLFGALISGWSWDSLGAGISFSIGSVFALLGFLLVYAGVRGEAGAGEAVSESRA
ncbi:MFS transporter [Rhodocyclus tenuis]|uniref:MFS transporter n=1 Tax=Rhodocyclus gracilis TaxID=2929842 RepID=A0ABX0WE24_9RHOO|nr:MFS transporter [Rhodocyclus gracilis]NJA87986.1 MFS transporter [Rhodocyclus gracilis]